MKKKILLFVVALCMSAISSAQPAKDNVIKAVEAKQNELLTNLKTVEGLNQQVLTSAKGEINQFWIEQGKTIKYGKKKNKVISASDKFKKIKNAITKKNGFEIRSFTYGVPKMSKAEPRKDKKGNIDKNTYVVVYDIHKCKTRLFNSYKDEENKDVAATNDACYNMTMTWIVKINKKKEDKIDAVSLESISAKANNDDELLGNLNKELNRLIKEWYDNNVPEYFAKQLRNENILRTQLVPQVQSIKITTLKREITVPVDNLPAVQVFVDPNKYMSPDSMYVNEPTAFYTFNPKTFIIKFSEDYKHGESSVEFENGIFSGPQTLSTYERNMIEAKKMANQTNGELLSRIEAFMERPNADNAKRLKTLFAAKGTVEIAYFTTNGVKREVRASSAYVDRLRNVKVAVEQSSEPTVNIEDNSWTATIPYTQRTSYGKKCDVTNKRICLVKDESGVFKIEKIVVENDPLLCE